METIGKIFWGFILLSMVLSIGSGPTVHAEIVRLSILGMVSMAFLFPNYISRKLFVIGFTGSWLTMLITAILSKNLNLILLPICIFAIVALVFTEIYFKRKFVTSNPTQ